jgi:SAM-dependent methyltransferase
MNPAETICFWMARRTIRKSKPGDIALNPATLSESAYRDWRNFQLRDQFSSHFSAEDVAGKRVLDLGCGTGELSFFVRELGAARVQGVDLAGSLVREAQQDCKVRGLDDVVSFTVCDRADSIPIPSSSVDVILCFDTMEHIMEYEAIIKEWRRVLAPGGQVLIWWSVWFHPYGHHMESIVPLPWVHLLLSEASLLRVCSRMYELPEFPVRVWHFDENGKKKPNPYAGQTSLGYLNKLTTWKFERVCQSTGIKTVKKTVVPFSGNHLAAMKRFLASLPFVSDFFCGSVAYKLQVFEAK